MMQPLACFIIGMMCELKGIGEEEKNPGSHKTSRGG